MKALWDAERSWERSELQLCYNKHTCEGVIVVIWWHCQIILIFVVPSPDNSWEHSSLLCLHFLEHSSCCIYRGWSGEAHLKLYMNIQLLSLYEKQPMCSCFCCFMHKCCKKCVIPSEECSKEHSLLSSHLRQPTWGCSTTVYKL